MKAAVIGASGYTGGELLRLLAFHDEIEVAVATSRELDGKPVHYAHPNLRGIYRGLKFVNKDPVEAASSCDVVFLALPHGVSLHYVPKLLEIGVLVVDLSADYRLKNPEDYKRWYGYEHPYPDLLKKAVYGLPELHRDELRGAKLIACPGCNSTASILALAPLVKEKLIDLDHIAVDVKVGSSEAGSKPSPGSHHPERANVIRPYDAEGHRHVAEVEQELSALAGRDLKVAFTPHAVGCIRGALASCYSWLAGGADELKVWRAYAAMYAKEPFVRIVRGGRMRYPDPKYVIGSNYADVGFAIDKRVNRIVAFAAIDNLVRGAAGQAIHCANITLGLPETMGLEVPPLHPA